MVAVATRTTLGGSVSDTITATNEVITHVYSDGEYAVEPTIQTTVDAAYVEGSASENPLSHAEIATELGAIRELTTFNVGANAGIQLVVNQGGIGCGARVTLPTGINRRATGTLTIRLRNDPDKLVQAEIWPAGVVQSAANIGQRLGVSEQKVFPRPSNGGFTIDWGSDIEIPDGLTRVDVVIKNVDGGLIRHGYVSYMPNLGPLIRVNANGTLTLTTAATGQLGTMTFTAQSLKEQHRQVPPRPNDGNTYRLQATDAGEAWVEDTALIASGALTPRYLVAVADPGAAVLGDLTFVDVTGALPAANHNELFEIHEDVPADTDFGGIVVQPGDEWRSVRNTAGAIIADWAVWDETYVPPEVVQKSDANWLTNYLTGLFRVGLPGPIVPGDEAPSGFNSAIVAPVGNQAVFFLDQGLEELTPGDIVTVEVLIKAQAAFLHFGVVDYGAGFDTNYGVDLTTGVGAQSVVWPNNSLADLSGQIVQDGYMRCRFRYTVPAGQNDPQPHRISFVHSPAFDELVAPPADPTVYGGVRYWVERAPAAPTPRVATADNLAPQGFRAVPGSGAILGTGPRRATFTGAGGDVFTVDFYIHVNTGHVNYMTYVLTNAVEEVAQADTTAFALRFTRPPDPWVFGVQFSPNAGNPAGLEVYANGGSLAGAGGPDFTEPYSVKLEVLD